MVTLCGKCGKQEPGCDCRPLAFPVSGNSMYSICDPAGHPFAEPIDFERIRALMQSAAIHFPLAYDGDDDLVGHDVDLSA